MEFGPKNKFVKLIYLITTRISITSPDVAQVKSIEFPISVFPEADVVNPVGLGIVSAGQTVGLQVGQEIIDRL